MGEYRGCFSRHSISCMIHRVNFLIAGEQEKSEGKITEFLPQMQICTSFLLSSLECLSETKKKTSNHYLAGKSLPA